MYDTLCLRIVEDLVYCIYSKFFRRLDYFNFNLVLMDLEEKTSELKEIEREVAKCQKCALYKTRQNTVPGEGNPESNIMFVGEAPGSREDFEGRPFCGPAGKFLDQLLDSIGLRRDDVFIANTLKCRPPNNRDPELAEKELCRKYLEEQIRVISPKIIVTLGRHSTETFLPGIGGISKLRAKLYRRPTGKYFFPLYHPAAALHNGDMRQTLLDDFAKLPAAIEKVREETKKKGQEITKNLKLF
jgi:uracil-DNA glycosylase